jgi:aquaporin Z
MNANMRACFAEAVGTFVLVFCGCGSAVLAGDRIGIVGISAAFGLAVLAMIYAIGPISGCHINPAVTIALWVSRRFQGRNVAGYIAAQLIGGILGAAVLLMIARGAPTGYDPTLTGFTATGYGEHSLGHYSLTAAFLAEIVFTGMLILTILGVTDVKAPVGFAGLVIGLYVVLALLVGIPVTGCSMNPARSIAVAVFARGWALSQLWLFIVAPVLGGILGAGLYELLRDRIATVSEQTAVRATTAQQVDRYATEAQDEAAGVNAR